jgi:MSHA biogenesis protein MshN
MSVINQMLKDLDQRSPEVNAPSVQTANATALHSPMKIALITAISVLVLCALTFYVWQLNSENNALKAQQSTQANTNLAVVKKPVSVAEVKKHSPVPAREALPKPISEPLPKAKPKPKVQPTHLPRKIPKTIVSGASSKVTPAKQDEIIAHVDDHSHEEGSTLNHSHKQAEIVSSKVSLTAKPEAKLKPKISTNKMSVSRRQLSADELAKQKLALAEKALAAKQVSKAEKLLEDVVIITPNDSQTRKKLAALWFGRQAYQDAVNLLSQGIALNNKDSSLRQMKARIHLKQGQATAALNTLKPLDQLKDEQYQIMLANTAQQAGHNKTAVNAYQVLIDMQPETGRWQLGLAVLYDKNSQFILASKAYKKALSKSDLSVSSEQFVNERLQAIGQ